MHNDRIETSYRPTGNKRTYATPTLVHHGLIRDLTQAGSNGTLESNSGGQCNGNSGTMTNPSFKNCNPASDVRLKHNIRRVGNYCDGIGLYLFDYRPEFKATCGSGTYLGVMAQEVLPILPSAIVIGANGYYAVDYTELRQLRH